MSVVIIKKNGSVINKTVENFKLSTLRSVVNHDVCLLYSWQVDDGNYVSLYGNTDEKYGFENKFELPPPMDLMLCFQNIIIVCTRKLVKNNPDYKSIVNLTVDLWNTYYEELYGGFETLDEDEPMSEDEYDENEEYTKEGYLKDGFVVDDDDDSNSNNNDDDDDDDEYDDSEYQDDSNETNDDELEYEEYIQN